jgi:glutamate synthase (NADPH/NADH) large chain
VVEGLGANGCEYMTGGQVVVLGPVGGNFAAGMTGGMAFVYDPQGKFPAECNPDSVVFDRIRSAHWEAVLRALVTEHAEETQSRFAADLLRDWDLRLADFWQVTPKEMLGRLDVPLAQEEAMYERA